MAPSVIEARPTTYNGIQMRSRLEADYAAWLDRKGHTWEYEPECFASTDGQWLPDFRVKRTGDFPVDLIELKPAGRLAEDYTSGEIDKHLQRMTIAWMSKPECALVLLYWRYGGAAEMLIRGTQGAPWLARGGPLPLLWTGMSQYQQCIPREKTTTGDTR
jgi:hypothetical protein